MSDFWSALKGAGESWAGRGPQWKAAQARMAEAETLRQSEEEQRRLAKLKAQRGGFWERVQYANDLLSYGDESGKAVLLDTLSNAESLGIQDLPQGVTGAQIAQKLSEAPDEALTREAQSLLKVGRRRGFLEDAEDSPKFSAVTHVLADGSALQSDNQGGTRLIGPDGREIADPALRAATIRNAQVIEREQARLLAGAKQGGTDEAAMITQYIENGIQAAERMPDLRRMHDLIRTVPTGGWDAVKMYAKEKLGIETADEGELAYRYGMDVVKQLKATFGGNMTVKEGEWLKSLEENRKRSPEANMRLTSQMLQWAENQYRIGRGLAESQGRTDAVKLMDQFYGSEYVDDWSDPREQAKAPAIKILGIRNP